MACCDHAPLQDHTAVQAWEAEEQLQQALEASRRMSRSRELEDEELARVERLSSETLRREREKEQERVAQEVALAERLSREAWEQEQAMHLALALSASPGAETADTEALSDIEAEELARAVGASIAAAEEDARVLAALAEAEEKELAEAAEASLAAARQACRQEQRARVAEVAIGLARAPEVHRIGDDDEDAGSADGLDQWWLGDTPNDLALHGAPDVASHNQDDDDDWVFVVESG